MRIEIVSLGPVSQQRGPKSTYSVFELTYKDDGKTKSKKIFSFNKEIFPTLSTANPGEVYEVKTEKKGQFWEWMAVSRVEGAAASDAAPAAERSGGNGGNRWQKDPEKEAQIARSVALKAALEYHTLRTENDVDVEAVVETSAAFEHYLLHGYSAKAKKELSSDIISDDIPFN